MSCMQKTRLLICNYQIHSRILIFGIIASRKYQQPQKGMKKCYRLRLLLRWKFKRKKMWHDEILGVIISGSDFIILFWLSISFTCVDPAHYFLNVLIQFYKFLFPLLPVQFLTWPHPFLWRPLCTTFLCCVNIGAIPALSVWIVVLSSGVKRGKKKGVRLEFSISRDGDC